MGNRDEPEAADTDHFQRVVRSEAGAVGIRPLVCVHEIDHDIRVVAAPLPKLKQPEAIFRDRCDV